MRSLFVTRPGLFHYYADRDERKAGAERVFDMLASGAISEAAAKVFLSSIGMSEANVQALIDDAKDGSIDTLPAEQA